MSGRRKFDDTWLWVWGAPAFCVILGVVLTWSSATTEAELEEIARDPVQTTATVVEIEERHGRRFSVRYLPTVSVVLPAGITDRIQLPRTGDRNRYAIGDEVVVRFAASDADLIYDVRYPPDPTGGFVVGWVSFVLAVLLVGGAAWFTWVFGVKAGRERKRKAALKARKKWLRRTRTERHLGNS